MPNGGWISPAILHGLDALYVPPLEARNDFWRLDFDKYFAPLELGPNCPFPKDQCHPSPALPINGIDGEGGKIPDLSWL